MPRKIALSVFALAVMAAPAFSESPELHLDFRAFEFDVYEGPVAPLSIQSDEEYGIVARVFTYVLKDGSHQEIEGLYRKFFEKDPMQGRFAGHFAILTGVCGTSNMTCGALVDVQTGQVVLDLPVTTTGAVWRANSGLLIADPFDKEANEDRAAFGNVDRTTYWLWNGSELVRLGEEEWPEPTVKDSGAEVTPPVTRAFEAPSVKFKSVKVRRTDPAELFRKPPNQSD